eukprot:925999-Rhodomonas_salina.1
MLCEIKCKQPRAPHVADQQPTVHPSPRRPSSWEADRPPQRQRVGTAPSDVLIPQVEAVILGCGERH